MTFVLVRTEMFSEGSDSIDCSEPPGDDGGPTEGFPEESGHEDDDVLAEKNVQGL
jgi:hypothetical protein